MIEDFLHLPPVSTTPVANLELRISPRIFEKIRNGPNGILRGLGEKNQKSKISWHCPFTLGLSYRHWLVQRQQKIVFLSPQEQYCKRAGAWKVHIYDPVERAFRILGHRCSTEIHVATRTLSIVATSEEFSVHRSKMVISLFKTNLSKITLFLC